MNIKRYTKYLCVVICFVVIFIFIFFFNAYPLKYKDQIKIYSKEANLKSALIASIINAESSFNTNAVSSKGAIGLMQIIPQTAKWVCEKNKIEYSYNKLFNAKYNIQIGCLYFSYLLNKFADEHTAICAYNAGEGTVANWLKNEEYSANGITLDKIPYIETKNYLSKVKVGINVYNLRLI